LSEKGSFALAAITLAERSKKKSVAVRHRPRRDLGLEGGRPPVQCDARKTSGKGKFVSSLGHHGEGKGINRPTQVKGEEYRRGMRWPP